MAGFSNKEEKGRPITIKDEGVSLTTNVASIDFTGTGVSGSAAGNAVTEDVSGGGGGGTPAAPDTSIQFNDGGSFGGAKLLYSAPDTINVQIKSQDHTLADTGGIYVNILGSDGKGTGDGGGFNFTAGNAEVGGNAAGGDYLMTAGIGDGNSRGGNFLVTAGEGGSNGQGGDLTLAGGAAGGGSKRGGNLNFSTGAPSGTGTGGEINITTASAEDDGGSPGDINITLGGGGGFDARGGSFNVFGGTSYSANEGGFIDIVAGNAHDTGVGGNVELYGGKGGLTSGNAGAVYLIAQEARGGDSDGGSIYFRAGAKSGAGENGEFAFQPRGSITDEAVLNFDLVTGEQVFTFPNQTGTIALISDIVAGATASFARTFAMMGA